MTRVKVADQVHLILADYDPAAPGASAAVLREFWLRFDPKSMASIKAEQREQQETVGIPVEVLRDIGKEIGKVAQKRVGDFIPLVRLLWD